LTHYSLYNSAKDVFKFIENYIQHGTIIYLDDVFAGFKENSDGGVKKAFEEFKTSSRYKYTNHLNVGWWGQSFVASVF
jgi:hypothetical protein